MLNRDVLMGLLFMAPLFLLFALFALVLVLRSRHNAAHPPAPEAERGPWPPRLSTGPWYAQLASYFPPYYSRPAMIGVALLFGAEFAFQSLGPGAAPAPWPYLAPFCLASWASGHAWAFVLDYLRHRMNRRSPGDVAQPVPYYMPDMAPASYQPTFRTLSSLIRYTPVAIGVVAIDIAVHFAVRAGLSWGRIFAIADLIGLVGFWIGCREIQRGVRAGRS